MEYEKVIMNAIKDQAFDKLLLGTAPYVVNDPRGASLTGSDIMIVLDYLNKLISNEEQVFFEGDVNRLSQEYYGIIPCLSVILFIFIRRNKGQCNININVDTVIQNLRLTITKNKYALINDFSEEGQNFPDGNYGAIKRLCGIIQDISGVKIL